MRIRMKSEFDITKLVADLAPAKVRKTSQPGVFEVKFARKAKEQKVLLLQRLYAAFPVRLLWLSDFLNEQLRHSLGNPLSTKGGAAVWMLPISPATLLDGLDEGSWAIFFLNDAPQNAPELPKVLWPEPGTEFSLLSRFSAEVGILSSEDDIEWTIISSPKLKQV